MPLPTIEQIVFAGLEEGLSLSDRSEVVALLDFELAEDGTTILDPVCRLPMTTPEVRLDDLNSDGDPELMINGGNACSAGSTGAVLWLFGRGADGRFRLVLTTIALGYQLARHRAEGYPDLVLGGPGFCHAVWRWTGTEYAFDHTEPEVAGGCDGR
ncbi:MAG: hypothetical protein O3A63_06275 [Proteobacteria bacterium]|nr:hypothetical protein [Pseudomonadota bacterium]